ncbi:MAG: hypothetical protein GXO94_09760 [Nitrospirae bacterium]|nr:hypothetical protein [Nitrospirota bacterium]
MDTTVSITFIGHSTLLIRMGGISILTDPNFDGSMGYLMPRIPDVPEPMELAGGEISLLAISHSHLDHLSLPSIRRIKGRPRILVPEKVGPYLKSIAAERVEEIRPGEKTSVGGVSITALPARHPSVRFPLGRKTGTNSYLFEFNGTAVYFVGDSGYSEAFRSIGERYSIDVALLPIGLATPSLLFGRHHLSPALALKAFHDLRAGFMIPVHYGTFRTILERPGWPLAELKRLLREEGLESRVKILGFGETWSWQKHSGNARAPLRSAVSVDEECR